MNGSLVALLAVLSSAVWWDLRERRIPNAVTLAGVVAALGLRFFAGLESLGDGAVGLAFGAGVAVPMFALGGMGGGDVKLLAAVGAFLGPHRMVTALVVTALVGGCLAVWTVSRGRAWTETTIHFRRLLRGFFPGASHKRRTLASSSALSVPYAVPIAVGAIAGWFAS